jgi:hypothetical protein
MRESFLALVYFVIRQDSFNRVFLFAEIFEGERKAGLTKL